MGKGDFDPTELIGVAAVQTVVLQQLGWIPRDQPVADFGIDLVIEEAAPLATGRWLGVQIKTGQSYLSEGDAKSIWFRTDDRHVQHWLGHTLPVILVLHDEISGVSYWVHINRTSAQRKRKNWRIDVPRDQILSTASKDALSALARKGGPPLPGDALPPHQSGQNQNTISQSVALIEKGSQTANLAMPARSTIEELAARVRSGDISHNQILGLLEQALSVPVAEGGDYRGEDPVLHEKINTQRELKNNGAARTAFDQLQELRTKIDKTETPYAYFRVVSNLASCALDLGQEAEAIAYYDEAYALQPDDPVAKANYALRKMLSREFDEAVRLARESLSSVNPPKHAITIYLYALGRTDWQGDPAAEIPEDQRGSVEADLGLIDFGRARGDGVWDDLARDAAKRHPANAYIARAEAQAILENVNGAQQLLGFKGKYPKEEILRGGRVLKAQVERLMAQGFADVGDVEILANNAAVMLRLAEAFAEARTFLAAVQLKYGRIQRLQKLIGVLESLDGVPDAVETLSCAPEDHEAQIYRAEILARQDADKGLEALGHIPDDDLSEEERASKAIIAAGIGINYKREPILRQAVATLRTLPKASLHAGLLEVAWERASGAPADEVQAKLKLLIEHISDASPPMYRFTLAEEASRNDMWFEASQLLEGRVDTSRISDALELYAQSLAASRRDKDFLALIKELSPDARESEGIVRIVALHAFNAGDFKTAEAEADKLRKLVPRDLWPVNLLFETLIHAGKTGEIERLLKEPLESLESTKFSERIRLAKMIFHVGRQERAIHLTYRLFLENRDSAAAWSLFASQMLMSGQPPHPWPSSTDTVGADAAVLVRLGNGVDQFFIVEPDLELRKLDRDSWDARDPLPAATIGKKVGDDFTSSNGIAGKILSVDHKYIHRVREVYRLIELRFSNSGLTSIPVDVEVEGGLDGILELLKQRRDSSEEALQNYKKGKLTIGLLALQLGASPVDFVTGLASAGYKLLNATGLPEEREVALREINENQRKGFVVDALTYSAIWRLKVMEAVQAVLGKFHYDANVIATLRQKRDSLAESVGDGQRTISYGEAGPVLHEVSGEAIQKDVDDLEAAIAWLEANGESLPVIVPESIPEKIKGLVRQQQTHLFDEVLVAIENDLILLTDDYILRKSGSVMGLKKSTWLHWVLTLAAERKRLSIEDYTLACASLVQAGHAYIGVTADVFIQAAKEDVTESSRSPRWKFTNLANALGGTDAEPLSHISVVLRVLRHLWGKSDFRDYRLPATSMLMSRLIAGRPDYIAIVNAVGNRIDRNSALYEFIRGWAMGHFLHVTSAGRNHRSPKKRKSHRGRKR